MDWEATYAFWDWADNKLGLFHMYLAIYAVVIGPVVLFLKKGDLVHRLLGISYVFSMFATNATALIIYDFTGGPNLFHFFAVVSLITVSVGLFAILSYASNRQPKMLSLHIEMMVWSYFGLFMAAGAESFTRGLQPQMESYRDFWIFFAVFMVVAGFLGSQIARRSITYFQKRWVKNDEAL